MSELQLPLRLEGSTIAFDAPFGRKSGQILEGKLGLISVALNPADPSRSLLLYTAVESGLLRSVVGAYEGPADFVVMEAGAVVKLGHYEKTRRPWRLK